MSNWIEESHTTLIGSGTQITGKVVFRNQCRIHAKIIGEVLGTDGSKLIFAEDSYTEGKITGDEIWINGYVRGRVECTGRIFVSRTGRVEGELVCPRISIESGAFFNGRCKMEEIPVTKVPMLSPIE